MIVTRKVQEASAFSAADELVAAVLGMAVEKSCRHAAMLASLTGIVRTHLFFLEQCHVCYDQLLGILQ